jgi:signal peptidase I
MILLSTNKSLLVFFVLMAVFRSAVADWMYVPSGSMNPTIVEGDRILVDKSVYGLRIPFTTKRLTRGDDPQRGDIAIFASPEDGTTLVKRIVGLPGDVIEMRDDVLLVNGAATDYDATFSVADKDLPDRTRREDHRYLTEKFDGRPHMIMVLPQHIAMRTFGPTAVPAGYYLALGDSRDNSKDSRYIGFVPRDSIVGRAFKVAYSLDADRWYRPRADRFFAPLE